MIDNVVYVVCAKPSKSSIVHEYLHSIFGKVIESNLHIIKEYVHLLNPVYESMFKYKYAWSKNEESWCRVFEESLMRAATIWINEPDKNELSLQLKHEKDAGFIYVPTLYSQLKDNWFGIQDVEGFFKGCLEACRF